MTEREIAERIVETMPFAPTREQGEAIGVFSKFVYDHHDRTAMVLRGSAGTGKTSLAGAIVRTMAALKQKMVLLAPTGRAAKVFALNSGHTTFTIHRRIYRQKSMDARMGSFNLNDNLHSDTLFIIDEASMVANQGSPSSPFGGGYLLDDLVKYVYGGQGCRMMLIGDTAQLPPIGETDSPALSADVLGAYGLTVYEAKLNEVLRQNYGSGILYNATAIRDMIGRDEVTLLPKVRFHGFADIQMVPGDELIEQLASSYSAVGLDDTMVVTRSNKRANIYNQGIRNMVLGREEELCQGDMLMVVKNNYHWAPEQMAYTANGDRARVWRVRNMRELYGFRFADLTLQFPDYGDMEFTATAMLDTLTSEAPALTMEQNERLFNAVMEDYADIPLKADRMKKMKEDKHYNALQVKFAYAVTCHKAQGGQWAHVYIDQGPMTDDMLTPDYIHWLYTAFTRATEKLFLVNWPKAQTESEA